MFQGGDSLKEMLEFYPIGSYLICEGASGERFKINQTLYGSGITNKSGPDHHGTIDVKETRSENTIGVFKVCGHVSENNGYYRYLIRRVE